MCATQTLKCSFSTASPTFASALWLALRSANAAAENCAGRAAGAVRPISPASPTSRHSRCTKRAAPCTPRSVHSTSRSGGESDSMNQRATSAPYSPMISSGSTVLRFDFDIFSIGPISTSSPVAISVARRASPFFDFHLRGRGPFAVLPAKGLVHHHALGEQSGERLFEPDVTGLFHGAGEEAAVEQMQDRVLDAADILIDRHPGVGDGRIGRCALDPRIGEAGEIPRRVRRSIHGVGLAPRRAAALRTMHVFHVG